MEHSIEDERGTSFSTEKALSDRGLPIYVFEQNDEEQLLSEEKSDVREAIEHSEAYELGEQELKTDVMTQKSDLETEIIEDRKKLFKDQLKQVLPCLCVHGKCRDGE